MAQHHFVDTSEAYKKREAMRFIGYAIIFILLFYGIKNIFFGGSIKTGLIFIVIGVVFWYLGKLGDKRNKRIYGRK